jgi:hypothetical protein
MTEPNPGNIKSPEKGYNYFVDHPDEVTVEDIEQMSSEGVSFLNNFHLKVFEKDNLEVREVPGVKKAISRAIFDMGFDFDAFLVADKRLRNISTELNKLFNNRDTVDASSEEQNEEKLKDLRAEAAILHKEITGELLKLYKNLRRRGFSHYPDLTQ